MEARLAEGQVELKAKNAKVLLDGGVTIGSLRIGTPGEYEVNGVAVEGLATDFGTVYHLFLDDLAIASLSGVNKVPSDPVLEAIEDADLVILPMEEGVGLTPQESAKLISTLEPKLVLLHPANRAVASQYCPKLETHGSLRFSKRDLPEDATRVALLT